MTNTSSAPTTQAIGQADGQPGGRSTALRGRWAASGVAAAAALVGAALFNRAAAKQAKANTPPEGNFIEVDDVRLHYVDRGDGPVVVLLHGNGVSLDDFKASGVLALAAKSHRVIAFDRPGFGYSDRPRSRVWTPLEQGGLIIQALQQLGVQRAVVVGHSWGTLVALAIALEEPALVQGLVLLSGYYYGTARPDVVPMSAPAIPFVGDILAHTISPLSGRLMSPGAIKASFHPAPVSENFKSFPLEMTFRPSQIRATAADTAMMVPGAIDLSRRYADLKMRVIAMAGEGDLIVHKDKHSERLVSELRNGELRVVPHQGHLFHYAVPGEVLDAIDAVWV
ncbi:alpha/beta fold hydrolase [Sphingomonas glaciei]|uniref:Alpha/beta hydrolase n=1 Tax=Sphingomonas glaciei TaxID=2938948 RepID=A0ABY5MY23_9SPHN|nr:alpha/beta hydrolase [Sphingomonas glaciei]UUR09343.1 alpha/beta hydrolase [Sphingomonas glaciei]